MIPQRTASERGITGEDPNFTEQKNGKKPPAPRDRREIPPVVTIPADLTLLTQLWAKAGYLILSIGPADRSISDKWRYAVSLRIPRGVAVPKAGELATLPPFVVKSEETENRREGTKKSVVLGVV